ncbi:unnamed protein product [Clonostachys byssicola]|uniref:BTB domain-containing protein n=1 Tax=Clonostachys byssicola TaxID=160290 RepID=A0A9N9V058_9HYPO|nr:unnamed protein product [Clonostachys byssicola]
MDAKPPKMLVFDEDGDTLIVLPYINEAADGQESIPNEDENSEKQSADGQEMIPNGDNNSEEQPADDTLETVRMKVSKKHLVLASRRAQKIFLGPWKETESEGTDGLHHWLFEPFFTPEAFEIVLNIIHGHTKKVPIAIGLATLADVAAVVDDLQCEDAVWFIVKSWIRLLAKHLPDCICEDLVRWILISSVFDEPSIFAECTQVAIQSACQRLDTIGLPIRPSIIDGIEAERIKLLDALMVYLEGLRDSLIRGTLGCNFECQSSHLGALLQGMHTIGILPILDVGSPKVEPSEAPHRGLSLLSVRDYFHGMPFPNVYIKSNNARNSIPSLHKCDLKWSLREHVSGMEDDISGLNLDEFVRK